MIAACEDGVRSALSKLAGGRLDRWAGASELGIALADYFACSFIGDPRLEMSAGGLRGKPLARTDRGARQRVARRPGHRVRRSRRLDRAHETAPPRLLPPGLAMNEIHPRR